ncbi:TerD family protein [Nocardia cyriacigeorgica]|uniref:TerD family protein n=1 Tax=Nocardia cyriacigeorgica TaxID=135487 RepID=UPI001892F7CD|nr:TerD family protein [Nocardia cyriacigeorgica]MBF6398390.1 TerD family protein [Nocardia cyriacigeorgica]MBF6404096.1 TerD family protein [Nocardia cyriacigeorgica]
MKLSKGANAPVPTSLLAVVVSWRSEHAVDAHALLLTDSGTVRNDRDLVFYNAPRHISQAVTLDQAAPAGTARLSVSLPRTEAEIARIVVSGSVDDGSFADVAGLTVTVHDAGGAIAVFEIEGSEPVAAMMFGEFYRRDGQWRFRAVAQGWESGMAGLVTEFGVVVDEPGRQATPPAARQRTQRTPGTVLTQEPARTAPTLTLRRDVVPELATEPPPPPDPERADWHVDPHDSARLRWWDGSHWTGDTRQRLPVHPQYCDRCGNRRRRKLFGGHHPCRGCAEEIEEYLTHWHTQVWRVLSGPGPQGPEWEQLWASLRYQRIDESVGRASLHPLALDHMERMVAFAMADGQIEGPEFERFKETIAELELTGPAIDDLYRRMHRGRTLTRLRAGDLPTVRGHGLHLDPEERVHFDAGATQIRVLAKGPKYTDGRLIVSNKKLRFVGSDSGIEMPWSRIVSVAIEREEKSGADTVVIAATSARGGARFAVDDPHYLAATVEGALRVAKRLALTPGQRDTRSIPQEVKAEVWQRDGGRCVECGDGHYLEFDHIIPLSRGGATSATNLQILCRACNRAKGARI